MKFSTYACFRSLTLLLALVLISIFILRQSLLPAEALRASSAKAAAHNTTSKEFLAANYAKLPLSFEANRGQAGTRVKYSARGLGYGFFLTADEAVLQLQKSASEAAEVRLRLLGANRQPRLTGIAELPGKSHYLLGDDPAQWRRDVPHFAKVKYEAVYPGIDVVYYGNQQQLEYDFSVAPGADPQRIRLQFAGADKLRVDDNGDLLVETAAGTLCQHKPVAYQEVDGQRRSVEARYELHYELPQAAIRIRLGTYDHSRTLVIDPLLNYSTLLGTQSLPRAVAVDAQGNAYVCGYLPEQANFPLTTGAVHNAGQNTQPIFVMKFNGNTMALVYSAIFGGTSAITDPVNNQAVLENRVYGGLAVDAEGNAYVTGYTRSRNFPTTAGAYQRTYTPVAGSTIAGFIVKLNPAGNQFAYATLCGPTLPTAIAVDNAGQAYVTGSTDARNMPTTAGAFQTTLSGPVLAPDTFVAKFSADGGRLLYSTYLGSGAKDDGMSIAVDAGGNAYVAGMTYNGVVGGGQPDGPRFPTTPDAFKAVYDPNNLYGTFVTKLNPTGTGLIYSTILTGGFGYSLPPNGGTRLVLDAQNNVYVLSQTRYANFPTTLGAYQRTGGSTNPNYPQDDVTLTKLNAQGSALIYSTYIGAENTGDTTGGLAVDAAGNAYVFYRTQTSNVEGCLLAKFNPTGSARLMAVPFASVQGTGVAVDASGNVYLTGIVPPPYFPTTPGSLQPQFVGTSPNVPTGFFTKLSETSGIPLPTPTPEPTPTPLPFAIVGGRVTDGASAEVQGLADVSVFLVSDGALIAKGKTDHIGTYTAGVIFLGQDYSLIPYRQGYSFNPPVIQFFSGPYERASSNFAGRVSATPPGFPQFTSYSVTGRVKTPDGRSIPNVLISIGNGGIFPFAISEHTTTDSNGNYSFKLLPGGDYAISAFKQAYRFSPDGAEFKVNQNLTIDFLVEDEPNQAAVLSAASYKAEIAPDSIVTAFGTALATTTSVATTQPLPEELAGTRVQFFTSDGGFVGRAPLFFVSPTQVNFLVPANATPGPAVAQIDYPNGKTSLAYFTINRVAPGLFTADATGRGLATAIALRVKADGTQSYEAVARFDSTQGRMVAVPIDLGAPGDQVYLLAFGTGLRHHTDMNTITAQLGGQSATVGFAGAQGSLAGLDQVNVLVPRALAGRGEVELALSAAGQTANVVKVWIK